jgi:hypothetical protein
MNTVTSAEQESLIHNRNIFAWLAVATLCFLLIPLVAMQFTDQVNWGMLDFIVMGVLLFSTGVVYIFAARKLPKKFRLVIGIISLLVFVFLWIELAVGVFTAWGS